MIKLSSFSSLIRSYALTVSVIAVGTLAFGVSAAAASVGEVIKANSFGSLRVNKPSGIAVDQTTGDVYFGDLETVNAEALLFQFTPSETREENSIPTSVGAEGAGNGQFAGVSGIAVDASQTPSTIYAIDYGNDRIQAFNAKTLEYESQFPVTTSTELEVGLAVDSSGVLYLPVPGANEVEELTATGGPGPVPSITGSGAGENALADPTRVAVDAAGDVYVLDHPGGVGRVEKFSANGTFVSVVDAGEADAVGVDPSNNDVWVVDGPHGEETVNVYGPSGALLAQTESAGVLGTGANVQNITIYGATHEAFVTVRGLGVIERLQLIESGPPAVEAQYPANIGMTSVTLNAEINPNKHLTTYQFVYGLTNSYGQAAPATPGEVGSDASTHLVTAAIDGLRPNTSYAYHVVAENDEGEVAEGPEKAVLTAPEAPATGQATPISPTEVTVDGTFNPGGQETRYYVEYGPEPCGGVPACAKSSEVDAGAGTDAVAPEVKLAGLSPLTVYHYRLVVTNEASDGGSVADGSENEFFTATAASAITDPPVSVADTSAVVAGEVLPEGILTSYRVEYGPTPAYGDAAPAGEGDAGAGRTGVRVVTTLDGLQADTEYHYRLVATNGVGLGAGVDRTFTTDGAGEAAGNPLPEGFSLTGGAPSSPNAAGLPNLSAVGPVAPTKTGVFAPKPKALTRAQKLEHALRACRRSRSIHQRRRCEQKARINYAPATDRKRGLKAKNHG